MIELLSCDDFWSSLDQLIEMHPLVIDRRRGQPHPHFAEIVYPLDYGYLHGTTTIDGGGIDAWRGSQPQPTLNAVVLTVDVYKRDAEIKLLIGCTPQERQTILAFHNSHSMRAVLMDRPEHIGCESRSCE